MKNIDEQVNPENELESAMRVPIFIEFANECLKIVEEKTKDNIA